ncbi:bifunctional GNAT family N-acetyltransferase/(deoxy)nucleoside triphosphate pyrophosphohydrolase [Magnetovibrio sp. PR-2]
MPVNIAVLETPRLRLRRLTEADADRLVELCNDEGVSRYTERMPYPYALSDAEAFIEKVMLDRNANTRHVFAMERRIEGDVIGTIDVNMGTGDNTFGYWLGKDFWGQGFGTEASRAAVRFAFERAKLSQVAGGVHPDNPASGRVLEKAGFVYSHINTEMHGRCANVEAKIYVQKAEDWFAREAAKPKLLVTAVALIDTDGRVLMAQRPEGKSMAGLWEFPGGKVHDDETPEVALVRELKEELDIDISESCLAPFTFASHAYESFHLIMPLYLCRTWTGTVKGHEGQELQWVKPNRLNQLPMPPADIPLVAMLMDYL